MEVTQKQKHNQQQRSETMEIDIIVGEWSFKLI